jgi:tetratricopeptide (TPR) repeat protein
MRGAAHASQKQYDSALADVDAAIEREPESAVAHEERAEILAEMKRYDEALAEFDKAAELAPKAIGPLVQKARVFGIQSKFKEALELLDRANELRPNNPGVLLLRASMYQELEEEEKALADVDLVLKLQPGHPLAMRFRAMLLAHTGKFDLAADELEKLQKAEPENWEIELQLALFYSAEKQNKKAIETFSSVLEKQPDSTIALRGRGDTLLGIGRQSEAIADYEKVLKLDPEDTGVLNNLAWVLATSPDEKLRDGARAIELATKACELTKYEKAHILSTLAAGYAETGDFKTAIEWSQKAVELGDEDVAEALQKELETYKKGEPFRELLTDPDAEKPDSPPPETQAAPAENEST